MKRRAFFRAALLGLVAVVTAVLLRRSCAGRAACKDCREFARCSLPWKETPPSP